MDDDLTAFLEKLEEIGFFDDEEGRNALMVISDHGNQMGSYIDTLAGEVERATPLMLYFMPQQMLERLDMRKGVEVGTSQKNFEYRSNRLNTPLDTYLTLQDMLGLELNTDEYYRNAQVPPASLFDLRESNGKRYDGVAPVTKCNSFYTTRGSCTLSYCVQ